MELSKNISVTFIQYLFSFLDIDEEEIWEDFVSLLSHLLSALDIAILLFSSDSMSECRDQSRNSEFLHLDQVTF